MPVRLFATLALVLAVPAGPHAAEPLDFKKETDRLALPLIENQVAVGLVVALVKDGRTQVLAYGETARGSGQPPDEATIYEIGSVSKAFTGVLLAAAVEAGRVHLDDPVQKFLPPGVQMPVKDQRPITLLHLATHTSGLPRLPDNFRPADPTNPYADYTVDQVYAFLNGHRLRRVPGTYEYSNFGMGLLGHVLALHQGAAYEQLVVEQIAGPLGMEDTRVALDDEQMKRLAPPYDADLRPAKNWDLPTLAGAGGLRSTARDMLAFLQANLAEGDRPLTRALRQSHVKRHEMDDGLAMGLGWHIARDGNTRWHNGRTGGYATWVAVVPRHEAGVAVLCNTATSMIDALGEQVTRVVCGGQAQPLAIRKPAEVELSLLKSYAGYYSVIPFLFGLKVTVEEGRLMVQATGQEKFPVYAESPTRFFYRVVDAQIEFVTDEEGKVDHLILRQAGREVKAKRRD